jgi:hypothetical protein
MIKFFREIRKNLLIENKTSKYFKYAIGEIVLVVIGILIALQINTWNGIKSDKVRFVKILKEIRLDLETDISNADDIRIGTKIDSIYNLILNDKLTKTDYQKTSRKDLFWICLQYAPFEFQATAFKKLENFQGTIPESDLIKEINKYYILEVSEYNMAYNWLRDQVKDRHDYLATNFNWYYLLRKNDAEATPEMIDFYLKNPIYKNWASQHQADNTSGNKGMISKLAIKSASLSILITDYLKDEHQYSEKLIKNAGPTILEEDESVLGSYDNIESIVKFTNRGGFLFLRDTYRLKKIRKDVYQNVVYNSEFFSFQRDKFNAVISLTYKNEKDSTKTKTILKIK